MALTATQASLTDPAAPGFAAAAGDAAWLPEGFAAALPLAAGLAEALLAGLAEALPAGLAEAALLDAAEAGLLAGLLVGTAALEAGALGAAAPSHAASSAVPADTSATVRNRLRGRAKIALSATPSPALSIT